MLKNIHWQKLCDRTVFLFSRTQHYNLLAWFICSWKCTIYCSTFLSGRIVNDWTGTLRLTLTFNIHCCWNWPHRIGSWIVVYIYLYLYIYILNVISSVFEYWTIQGILLTSCTIVRCLKVAASYIIAFVWLKHYQCHMYINITCGDLYGRL